MRRLLILAAAGAAVTSMNLLAATAPIRCGIEMRNVALRAADGVVLNIRALDGEFVARAAGRATGLRRSILLHRAPSHRRHRDGRERVERHAAARAR